MSRFKVGLVTVAASAALLTLTASAVATTSSASTTTSLSMTCTLPLACFDIYDNGGYIPHADLMTAATFCGVAPVVLMTVPIGTWVVCGSPDKRMRRVECAVLDSLAADSLQDQAHKPSPY
jgi:hypothetical protein